MFKVLTVGNLDKIESGEADNDLIATILLQISMLVEVLSHIYQRCLLTARAYFWQNKMRGKQNKFPYLLN